MHAYPPSGTETACEVVRSLVQKPCTKGGVISFLQLCSWLWMDIRQAQNGYHLQGSRKAQSLLKGPSPLLRDYLPRVQTSKTQLSEGTPAVGSSDFCSTFPVAYVMLLSFTYCFVIRQLLAVLTVGLSWAAFAATGRNWGRSPSSLSLSLSHIFFEKPPGPKAIPRYVEHPVRRGCSPNMVNRRGLGACLPVRNETGNLQRHSTSQPASIKPKQVASTGAVACQRISRISLK